jgi:type II secretory pathway pseudopilin PulG
MKRFNIKNIEKALTIKELIFSITIIAVLTSMLFVIIKPLSQNDKAYDTRRVSDLKTVQKALERYQFDNGRYPESSSGSGN